jgi:hypothetical protein
LPQKKGADARKGNWACSTGILSKSGIWLSLAGLTLAMAAVRVAVASFFALTFHAQWDTYRRFR